MTTVDQDIYNAYQIVIADLTVKADQLRADRTGPAGARAARQRLQEQRLVDARAVLISEAGLDLGVEYDRALREDWARRTVAAAGKDWATHMAKLDGTVVER